MKSLELRCSRCKRVNEIKVKNGHNTVKSKCKCGKELELVVIISTRIEAMYEIKNFDLNLENVKVGIGESKRWQKEECSQKK